MRSIKYCVFMSLLSAGLFNCWIPGALAAVIETVAVGGSNTAGDEATAVNLIQAGQSSLAGVTADTVPALSPTFSIAGLNDGSAAANSNLTYYAVNNGDGGNFPATVTFNLNTNGNAGGSPTGYDISSVQVIAGWTDSNFGNQKYQLLFSIGGGPFLDYGTFIANTTTNGGNNSVLTTLTSSSGLAIAKGVTAIQLIFLNPGGNQGGSGGTVIHEIQAFGTPTLNLTQVAPYRIMVLGDSISAGYLDNPNWTLPYQFGYRNGLLKRLVNADIPFKFVGGSPEPWNGVFGTPTNVPNPDLRSVGQDGCEGYGGKTTAFILGNIGAWLSVDKPDIILLMAGINDIGQGSSGEPTSVEVNLSNIVATVVSQSPNTRLIIAQITPYATYTDSIIRYNNYIANVLVPYFAGQGKHVTTVNQYTNLCVAGTTNIDPTLYANGINHPKNEVYDRMAQTWFNGIQALSMGAPKPVIVNENLVVNGGFEAPQFGANTHNVNPANSTGWAFSWGGVSGAGAGIDNGNAYGSGGTNSYDGSQRACLQSSGNSTATHLSQAVSGFKVGQYYQLSFWAKGIASYSGANPFKVSITSGNYTNVLFGGDSIVPPATGFVRYTSAPFQATNTVMTLDFADLAPGDVTHVSWIDGVSINPVSGANVLANGGFEAPAFQVNSHNISPSPGYGWTFTSGISGAGSGIDNGDPYGNNNGSSIEFDGRQQGCLQSSGNGSVTSISQTVTNLTAGRYYQVSFLAKAINGYSGVNPFKVKTIIGAATNMLFDGNDIIPTTSGYTLYTSAPFQATNSTMTLIFADHGLNSAACVSWLDDVSLCALALPAVIVSQSGSNLIFSGSGGTPETGYAWLTATNVSAPASAWTTNVVGMLDENGSFTNIIPVDRSDSSRFFRWRFQ